MTCAVIVNHKFPSSSRPLGLSGSFRQTAGAESVNHLWGFLCFQTVWAVSEAKQTAGEMPEKLQVHRYRVSVCGVWRKGNTYTQDRHDRQREALSIDDDDDDGGGACLRVSRCGRSGWMFTHWIMMETWWMPPASPPSPLCATSGALTSAPKDRKSQWWVSSTTAGGVWASLDLLGENWWCYCFHENSALC